jgi:lysophospholipase L1-like esterase
VTARLRVRLPAVLAVALAFAFVLAAPLGAEEKKEQADNPAAKSIERLGQKNWKDRHEKFVEVAKKGDVDVLFLGDSITQGWEGKGKEVWKKNFEPLKAANFGIGGDQTGHVLWRITEGKELEGINPKVAVIMIGTNNTGSHTPAQIAGGVEAIVQELRKQKPQMKILLLAVFPRAEKPDDPRRLKVKETNALIKKLDDGKNVFYKDIGDKFVEADGTISKEIMEDHLHLTARGYGIWADAIRPDVEKLLK